jgi:penicillin-binding protein 2
MLIRGFTSLTSLSIAKDVSRETVAELEERHQEFPGIYTDVETFRKYTMGETAGHVVGFVRPMDEEEYKKYKEEGYRQDEVVGKMGIEAFAEPYLRGKAGQKKVEVDITGRLTEELETNPAIPGNTVKLTLDMNLQRVAMESIERNLEIIRSRPTVRRILEMPSRGRCSYGCKIPVKYWPWPAIPAMTRQTLLQSLTTRKHSRRLKSTTILKNMNWQNGTDL